MSARDSEKLLEKKLKQDKETLDKKSFYDQLNVADVVLYDDIVSIMTQLESNIHSVEEPSAIENLIKILIDATSIHSSLPRQYTFLFSYIEQFQQLIEAIPDNCSWKKKLCSIFSVVCTISPKRGSCLKYYHMGLPDWDITCWGLEYAKHLGEDIRIEYTNRFDQISDSDNTYNSKITKGQNLSNTNDTVAASTYSDVDLSHITNDEMFSLANQLIKFLATQNAELDAVDLAMEIEDLSLIYEIVNESNCERLLHYLRQCCNFLFETELDDLLEIIYKCYLRFGYFSQALLVAIKHDKPSSILDVLTSWDTYKGFDDDKHKQLVIKQIAYMLRHFEVSIEELLNVVDQYLECGIESAKKAINYIIEYNTPSLVADSYELVIRELDVNHPKKIEDVIKETTDKVTLFFNSRAAENPKIILSNFLSSGFLNAGFKESYIHDDLERSYISKMKDYLALTASASYGLVNLFDSENGLLSLDKLLYSPDQNVKNGALLGCGILSINNPDALDATMAILSTSILFAESKQELISSMIALSISMVGRRNNDALDILEQIFNKHNQKYIDLEIIAYYSLSVGMIGLGSCKVRECKNLFDYILKMKDRLVIQDINATFLILGYSLLYFKCQDVESLEADLRNQMPNDHYVVLCDYIITFLRISAYAASGHTVIVENLLMQISNLFVVTSAFNIDTSESATVVNYVPKNTAYNSPNEILVQELCKNYGTSTNRKNNYVSKNLTNRLINISINDNYNPLPPMVKAKTTNPLQNFAPVVEPDHSPEHPNDESNITDKKDNPDNFEKASNEDSQAGTDNLFKVGKFSGVIHASQALKDNDTTGNQMLAAVSAIGIAIICVSEDPIIVNMCFRQFNNLLQFGDRYIRRTVPFGLAIISASNPEITFIDTLNRLAYDSDSVTACNAILALGIIGAGSNNSKIGSLLRDLSIYYYKDPVIVFTTRVALGILHAGRGMLTMSPYMGCKSFVNSMSLASLFVFAIANIDSKSKALGNDHYLFYWLACCLKPRYLITFDENGKHIKIPVRVGTSVDTAGMAGDPRKVTGFQTQNTPVVLGPNERAELANSEYEALSHILEGIVIVRKRSP